MEAEVLSWAQEANRGEEDKPDPPSRGTQELGAPHQGARTSGDGSKGKDSHSHQGDNLETVDRRTRKED